MALTKVTNIIARQALKPQDGDVVFVEDTKDFFIYHDENYTLIPKEANLALSLYDMNAQIMNQLPTLSKEDMQAKKQTFKDFLRKTENNFYMLYGKEISYFTIFHNLDPDIGYIGYQIYTDFYEVLLECLHNIGEVKSFDLTEAEDAFEVWVKVDEDKTTCLYFFPYDSGIVYVQEEK